MKKHVAALESVFRRAKDKYRAHEQSVPVLQDLSMSRTFLTDALRAHLSKPGALNELNYPAPGIEVSLNAHFALVLNCWIPLPDRRTTLSTKAVHHHGIMLMSTATVFGPGYEHWTFSKAELADAADERFVIRLKSRAQHPLHHVDFVADYEPHLPFYPSDLSITLALWSHRARTSWRDHVKRLPFLHGREKQLRALVARLGLGKVLDLKLVEYFDFYPVADGFRGIRERLEFERGPNEDHLHSLFHVIQRTGNQRLAPLIRERLRVDRVTNRGTVERLLSDLERDRPIEGRLSAGHTDKPYANFTIEQLERALAAVGGAPSI